MREITPSGIATAAPSDHTEMIHSVAANDTPNAEDTAGRATDGAPTATETGAANAPNTIPVRRADTVLS